MNRISMLRIFTLLAVSIGVSLLVARASSQQAHYAWSHWKICELSVDDLENLTDRLVVDARSRELFEREHIPGAILLSEERWDEGLPVFLTSWQPEHPMVIYCSGQACAASKHVALRLLADLPDAHVYVLKGGFPAWQSKQARR